MFNENDTKIVKHEMKEQRIKRAVILLEEITRDLEDACIDLQEFRSISREEEIDVNDAQYKIDKNILEVDVVREANRFFTLFTEHTELKKIYYNIVDCFSYLSCEEDLLRKHKIID